MKTLKIMRIFRNIFLVSSLLFVQAALAEFDEGIEYAAISPQPPVVKQGPVEVTEFFWYGCPHCYNFEPYLDAWLKKKPEDVKFSRVPATFNKPAKLHARVYYALDLMGEAESVHKAIFDAMHKQGKKLQTVSEIEELLEKQGVNIETFRKALRSFAVQTKVGQAGSLFRKNGLRGVPAIVVGGRYRSESVQNFKELIDVMDYMVDIVRKEKKAD